MEITPTQSRLEVKYQSFNTICEALDYAALGCSGINFYAANGSLQSSFTYRDLRLKALECAEKILGLGLVSDACVGIFAETDISFLSVFYAGQYASFLPCPLPFNPAHDGKEEYIAKLKELLSSSAISYLIAQSHIYDWLLSNDFSWSGVLINFDHLMQVEIKGEILPRGQDDLAYVQFSSGSVSDPKGVLISQRAVCANVKSILSEGMRITAADRACSWLPFYHDMGLVGFSIAALFSQRSVDYLAPQSFAKRPSQWLRLISENHCSITYAPVFAYGLAVSRVKDPNLLDLSSLKVAGVGGDLIDFKVLRNFQDLMISSGFNPAAWMPSYGMAEATLAISMSRGLVVSDFLCESSRARKFVSCGKVLGCVDVSIRQAQIVVEDGCSGNIWIKSTSAFSGYLSRGCVTRAELSEDGYFDTGDIGFLKNEELYVVGRAKEVIQLRGVNYWPQDIEWFLSSSGLIKAADVVAFAICNDGLDQLIILVQAGLCAEESANELRSAIFKRVLKAFGLEPKVVLVPKRTFPVTSSGKISRVKAKKLFLDGLYVEKKGVLQ